MAPLHLDIPVKVEIHGEGRIVRKADKEQAASTARLLLERRGYVLGPKGLALVHRLAAHGDRPDQIADAVARKAYCYG